MIVRPYLQKYNRVYSPKLALLEELRREGNGVVERKLYKIFHSILPFMPIIVHTDTE
jgi:hypothetical protein